MFELHSFLERLIALVMASSPETGGGLVDRSVLEREDSDCRGWVIGSLALIEAFMAAFAAGTASSVAER